MLPRFTLALVAVALLAQCQGISEENALGAVAGVVVQSKPEKNEKVSRDFQVGYDQGREDALRDLREGRIAIEMFGPPPPPERAHWDEILRERGIEVRQVAGCVIDEEIIGHSRGYNEVSEAEIERRFGADFLNRMWKRAEGRHRQSLHPPRSLR